MTICHLFKRAPNWETCKELYLQQKDVLINIILLSRNKAYGMNVNIT